MIAPRAPHFPALCCGQYPFYVGPRVERNTGQVETADRFILWWTWQCRVTRTHGGEVSVTSDDDKYEVVAP